MLTTIENSGTQQPEFLKVLLFKEKGPSRDAASPASEATEQTETRPEKAILCRSCLSPVTSEQQAISIHDRHLHAFFNPAGVLYEVRCFKGAPGARTHGPPTDEFTWFPGYIWQYCVCAACLAHLGWFFSSSGDSFYGLIPAKLTEMEGD